MMRSFFVLSLLLIAIASSAQKLEYEVQFYGIGDNREFQSQVANSQTILGERTSFAIGTTLEGNHHFRIGLDHLFEFGSEMNEQIPKLIAYYQYEDERKTFYFGAFPRLHLINFPLALLTDTLNYYRPNIEGMYGRYNWSWGHQDGFVDWTSRQTDTRRETFLAGFSGEMRYRSLFFQNFLTLFHFAGRAIRVPGENVEDDMGAVLYVGSYLDKLLPLQKGYIRLGGLESTFRERHTGTGFQNTWSFTGELYGETKNFALRCTLSEGQGHHLMMGDRFYDVGNYIRTDVYWKFINGEHIQGKFNLSFHVINGSKLDQSQQLSVIYRLASK